MGCRGLSQNYRQPQQRRRVLTAEQKRRILKKRRMRRLKKRLMMIVPVAAVLIIVLILVLPKGGNQDNQQNSALDATLVSDTGANVSDADANNASGADAQDANAAIPDADTQIPMATAEPVETAFDYDTAYVRAVKGETTGASIVYDYSGIDPTMLDRWTEAKQGYIPILRKANTTENIICVTVDDCYQGPNFNKIVQCAIDNNAKLTIFPIGENLEKETVADALRLAYANGMEIGNHTYTHSGLFHYDQDRMRDEIWFQRQRVNMVLGVNYEQHFFRPRGGDERECQRLHAYLNQLGYAGVAMWVESGSNTPVDKLLANLAPGDIYLFHTTDNDLNKLLEFIPAAVARGYRLVTMSEMFGLGENAISEYQLQDTAVEPESFQIIPKQMKATVYNRAAAVVQQRLIDLGWMSGEATGVYGEQTELAVKFFQLAMGMDTTGVADVELQKVIFSDNAPQGSLEQVQAYCRQLGLPVLNVLPGTLNTQ